MSATVSGWSSMSRSTGWRSGRSSRLSMVPARSGNVGVRAFTFVRLSSARREWRAGRAPGARSRRGRADVFDGLAGRVVELPVEVPLAGVDRAGVAAAHGDHDVCRADDFLGPGLGELGGDVDAAFGHRGDRRWVHLGAGLAAAGPGDGVVPGEVGEEAHRHLGPTGVVHAQEQHDRSAVVGLSLHTGERVEALPGEALGEQRQVVGDDGMVGELVVAAGQERLDGLLREDSGEPFAQVRGGGAQRELLVDRQGGPVRSCRVLRVEASGGSA